MKNNLKLIIILAFIVSIILFNIFIKTIFTVHSFSYLLFWILLFIILKTTLGFAKDKTLYQIDVMQIIFIFCAIYLILTYLLGLVIGFTKNIYSLRIINILKNITPALIVIISKELSRYIIINKSKEQKIFIFIFTFIFIIIEIITQFNLYTITNVMDIFELIVLIIIAITIKNMLLSYISYKNGYKPTILYRLIFEIPIYFLPIFPNLGIYIEGVLTILFPSFLFLQLNNFYTNKKVKRIRKTKIKIFIFYLPGTILLGITIAFVSGLFKFYVMAVGSNSMYPIIAKGDAIIVRKIQNRELAEITIGDVIAYEYDKRIIIHRVIEINKRNKSFIYITKGDNNAFIDGYEIEEKSVRGIVKANIKYIGYPSVWLSELIN